MSEFNFVDTDDLIHERMGEIGPIWNPFLYSAVFYDTEDEVLDEMAEKDNLVIATGALATSHKNILKQLRKNGVIIRLHPDVETVVAREKQKRRFFLVAEGESYEDAIARDYHTYRDQYLDYDYSFDVSDEEPPETYAARILDHIYSLHGSEIQMPSRG
ncbi:MAG: hypothetical protein LUC90_04645 [Lachnospiraceae bacterium]|nr:hypothetical protein [Lachnospiraceae bacterium]